MDLKKAAKKGMSSGIGFTYLGLALLRIILVIVPQKGYIHPDEYFQSLEIVTSDIFKAERATVWEFDERLPIRNIAIPYFFYGIPCAVLRWILSVTNFQGTVSPYILLIFPRLIMCLLSFSVDFSLISICQKCVTNIKRRLILLASSYVMLVYGCRTFSNTIEMMLFSALLRAVVVNVVDAEEAYPREMKLKASLQVTEHPRQKILILRQLKQLTHRDYSGSVEIGLLTVIGVFNRPTFVAFATGPVLFWLYRGPPLKKISFFTIHLRCIYLLSVAVPASLVLVWSDTIYYKRENVFTLLYENGLSGCLNHVDSCLIITPLNFLQYNLNTENLAKHGVHPRYLHIGNLVLLFNVLAINCTKIMFSVLVNLIRKRHLDTSKFNIINNLMLISVLVPVIALSVFSHQEPRFLIPLMLPVIFLSSLPMLNVTTDERGKSVVQWKKILFTAWLGLNAILVIFYGFLHQGGLLPALKHLTVVRNEMQQRDVRIHVLSSHTYAIPKTFLTNFVANDNNKRYKPRTQVIVYNTQSSSFDVAMQQLLTLNALVDRTPPHDDLIYFFFPSSLTRNFTEHETLKQMNLKYSLQRHFCLHLSVEALPNIAQFFVWNLDFLNSVGLNVVLLKSVKYPQPFTIADGYFSGADEPSIDQFFNQTRCSF